LFECFHRSPAKEMLLNERSFSQCLLDEVE
jgi:hypothetical protein